MPEHNEVLVLERIPFIGSRILRTQRGKYRQINLPSAHASCIEQNLNNQSKSKSK